MVRVNPPSPGAAASGASALLPITERAIESLLARDPVEATYLGDHGRDGLLPDPSPAAAAGRAPGAPVRPPPPAPARGGARAAAGRARLAERDPLEPASLGPDDAVDAAVLRTALAAELLDLDEIREGDWNPMLHNPGAGVHSLISRAFAPLPERIAALEQRLRAVPDYLAAARGRLAADMSRIHLDTALSQLAGTKAMIDSELPADGAALRAAADS